jgi:vacuolar-type H+-ATPase subunit E/Vma4
MQETDKKLEAFTDTIIAQATDEANAITAELREKQEDLVKKAETEIAAETDRNTKAAVAEIKAEQERRITAQRNQNKHAMLEFREQCATDTYNAVLKKIGEYTASNDYLSHLKQQLKSAVEALGEDAAAEVYLREEDLRFADELLASVPGAHLAFSEGDFALGGLRLYCPSKGQRIDMSFDTALGDMVGHITELTGMDVSV